MTFNWNYSFLVLLIFASISFNLKATPYQIGKLTETLRVNEVELRNLQNYKDLLLLQKSQQLESISQANQEISNSVVALYKSSHIPYTALLVGSKSSTDIAVSFALLKYHSQYSEQSITNANNKLLTLQAKEEELYKVEKRITYLNNQIKQSVTTLRRQLRDGKNPNTEQSRKLLKEANGIPNLIKQINNGYNATDNYRQENESFFNNYKGALEWPSTGFINTPYNAGKRTDIYYNGISILALPNSVIVAPAEGKIIFNDYIDEYNSLIIIQHAPAYFSIISGDFESYVLRTQLVKKNEPLAITGGYLHPIYFEFQQNGEPVNPSNWLSKRQ